MQKTGAGPWVRGADSTKRVNMHRSRAREEEGKKDMIFFLNPNFKKKRICASSVIPHCFESSKAPLLVIGLTQRRSL